MTSPPGLQTDPAKMPLAPPRFRTVSLRAQQSFALLAAVAAWELAPRAGWVSPLFVPPPSDVLLSVYEMAQEAQVRFALIDMAIMVTAAFLIAGLVGIAVGAMMGVSKVLYAVFHSPVMLMFSTPKMIFLPIFILLLGVGNNAKIAYGVVSAVFPVIITVAAGVRDMDERLLRAARSMGATKRQLGFFVIIPGSVPAIVTGLWYCLKHALLGVLIMELFVSQHGIGYFIRIYTSSFRSDRVFGIVITLSILAGLMGAGWSALERRSEEWRTRN